MASFSAGTTFTDGVANDVTAAKLGALVNNATPTSGLIQDRTAETVTATNDTLLIGDASDSNALKRITVANFAQTLPTAKITTGTIDTATLGTTTGTAATFTSGTLTTGVIPTGTFGTTTSTAATITTGTLTTGVIPTGTFGTTTSTAATITTGTIPTLVATTLVTTGTGTAAAPAIVPTGDTNTGIFFPAADTIAATTQGTERLRIDSSGRVGIGVTPSNYGLEIGGTGANSGFKAGISLNGGQSGGDYDGIGYNFRPTNTGDVYNYNLNDASSRIEFYNGGFLFKTASSGIAGNAITYTERLRIDSSGDCLVTSNARLGYGAGSGGTVTQTTNKSTAVTLNKPTGQITMSTATLANGASVSFALNNSLISAVDVLAVNATAFGGYTTTCVNTATGAATIRVTNISGGSLSEAVTLQFAVIKGATS
jgi:hypothetical protein